MKMNKKIYIIISVVIIGLLLLFLMFNYKNLKTNEYEKEIENLKQQIENLEKTENYSSASTNTNIINTANIFIEKYFKESKNIVEKIENLRPLITENLYNELRPSTEEYNDTDNIKFTSSIGDLMAYYNKTSNSNITTISTFTLNTGINDNYIYTKKLMQLKLMFVDGAYKIDKILINSNLS